MSEMKIYKYPVPLFDGDFEIPAGFRPIHVGFDPKGDICMWAEITEDPQWTHGRIAYHWAATGESLGHQHTWSYVGTIMQYQEFVWHLYWYVSQSSKHVDATS